MLVLVLIFSNPENSSSSILKLPIFRVTPVKKVVSIFFSFNSMQHGNEPVGNTNLIISKTKTTTETVPTDLVNKAFMKGSL